MAPTGGGVGPAVPMLSLESSLAGLDTFILWSRKLMRPVAEHDSLEPGEQPATLSGVGDEEERPPGSQLSFPQGVVQGKRHLSET